MPKPQPQTQTREITQEAPRQAVELQDLFEQFPDSRYNLLAPRIKVGSLPAGTQLSVREVRVKLADCFKIAGGSMLLGKNVLDTIAAAAGVQWTAARRIDPRAHPHYCEYEAVGHVVDFDGTTRTITDTKSIDLRADAGGGVPGADYEEMVTKAKAANRSPDRQLMEARKFMTEICISKARNRAIATVLGIKRSYDVAELKKPFIIPKLVPDTRDPETREAVRASMTGATEALYWAKASVAPDNDAAIDRIMDAADVAPDVEPPHDPETGVVDEGPPDIEPPPLDTKKRLGAAWRRGESAGMSKDGWQEIMRSSTEKSNYDDLGASEIEAVETAVDKWIAKVQA